MNGNPFLLDGKIILVTGASSGIGRATAVRISLLGGICILSGRDEGRLEETLRSMAGEGHLVLPGDLANEGFVPEMIAHAVSGGGLNLRIRPLRRAGADAPIPLDDAGGSA